MEARKNILEQAINCVCNNREREYGSPEDSFSEIAKAWEWWLHNRCAAPGADICITAEDVAIMMALMKIARVKTGAFKEDSFIDACGYMACAGEIAAWNE